MPASHNPIETTTRPETALSRLPAIDELRRHADGVLLADRFGTQLTLDALRQAVDDTRTELQAGADVGPPTPTMLLERARAYLYDWNRPRPAQVINMSGTVLHTNLGRAPLAPAAIEAITTAAAHPTDLEIDIASGKRGQRDRHVVDWLRRLTGAESATVVNNNAAAVLLVLNTLGLRKQVPVSRGELVEIGGSFRMPDVMARAGCKLVEVGTTNKTHPADYANAIDPRTAHADEGAHQQLRGEGVHGQRVGPRPVRACARARAARLLRSRLRRHGDLAAYGLPAEDTPAEAIKDGFDLVAFSGDKLLGGPQCGIIVGRRELIDRISRNPLKRALRVDKLTMAALSATLPLYGNPDRLLERLPALRLLARKPEDMRAAAESLSAALGQRLGKRWSVDVVDCESQVGSGSMALAALPSLAVAITARAGNGGRRAGRSSAAHLAAAFRALPLPVLPRVHEGALLLDMRCLEDESPLLAQLDALAVPQPA